MNELPVAMTLIALLSDLGIEDYYVGSMKGAIYSINPEAKVVDITHEIPKQDIRTASFVLANAAETFPEETIFVVVVDPGVGTERSCILLRTENDLYFIGPDNGVFTLVAERFGVKDVHKITNERFMRSEISATFHGRDVMSPVAANLSLDISPSEVGPETSEIKLIDWEGPEMCGNEILGEVLKVDSFGNVVTNIDEDMVRELAELGDTLKISLADSEFEARFVETFDDVQIGEKLCQAGSAGLLEISKNQRDLASEIDAVEGSKVTVKPN